MRQPTAATLTAAFQSSLKSSGLRGGKQQPEQHDDAALLLLLLLLLAKV
jgi:hypothetical protein